VYFRATYSCVQPAIDAARTIKQLGRILRWHDTHIADDILDRINSSSFRVAPVARSLQGNAELRQKEI
jgi:hypothetical protein